MHYQYLCQMALPDRKQNIIMHQQYFRYFDQKYTSVFISSTVKWTKFTSLVPQLLDCPIRPRTIEMMGVHLSVGFRLPIRPDHFDYYFCKHSSYHFHVVTVNLPKGPSELVSSRTPSILCQMPASDWSIGLCSLSLQPLIWVTLRPD